MPEAIPHQPEADSFDFLKSWQSIKQACAGHRRLIATTTFLTIALVLVYIVVWPPVYKSEVVLVADAEKDTQRDNFYQTWSVFRKDDLSDEVKMMTADPVLMRVIEELNLGYDDVYHSFLHFAVHLWRDSWLGQHYRRLKLWLFPKEPTPYAPTEEEIERGKVLFDFRDGVALTPVPETHIGFLVVLGPSPRVAQVANTIVKVYFQERQQRQYKEAEQAYQALFAEAEKAKGELMKLEDRMKDYFAENSLYLMFEKDKQEIGQWLALKESIVEMETTVETLEKSLTEVNRQLGSEPRDIRSVRIFQQNNLREGLRGKLKAQELALQSALLRFLPDAREVKDIEREIAEIQKQVDAEYGITEQQSSQALNEIYTVLRQRKIELESKLAGAKAGLQVRRMEAEQRISLIKEIPEKMRITHDMEREHNLLEKKYSALQEKLMTAAVSKATAQSAPPSMRIVQQASAPEEADWPKTKTFLLLAIVLGMLSGVLLALFVDLVYGRVNRYRLSKAQGDMKIYAIVEQDPVYLAKLYGLTMPANGNRR